MSKDLVVQEKQMLQLKAELNQSYLKTIKNFFNNNEQQALKFMTSAVACIDKTPKLLECTKDSLFKSLMTCAEFQLHPIQGEAHILPFYNKTKKCYEAKYIIGYPGVATLIYRAGAKKISSQVVYKKDHFKYSRGLDDILEHEPADYAERGDPMGAYVVVTLESGEKDFMYMCKEEIYEYRDSSPGWNGGKSSTSPWHQKNDPQLWMWRKTVLKQLAKLLPKNKEIAAAISKDYEAEIIDMKADENPTDMDIQAFVQEAKEYLYATYNSEESTKLIEDALKAVTGGDSWHGITTEQLEAVKKLIFTGEVVDGEPPLELK